MFKAVILNDTQSFTQLSEITGIWLLTSCKQMDLLLSSSQFEWLKVGMSLFKNVFFSLTPGLL